MTDRRAEDPRHHPRATRRRRRSTTRHARRATSRSLLTQERPNIFTQKVANIEPGKRSTSNIRYFHTLAYRTAGTSSCSRWSSARASTRRARPMASARWRARTSPSRCRTRPCTTCARASARPRHRLSVDLDAGVAIEELDAEPRDRDARATARRARTSSSDRRHDPEQGFRAPLQGGRRRDQVEPDDVHGRAGQGYFTLMLCPPRGARRLAPPAAGDGVHARRVGQHERSADRAGAGRDRRRARSPRARRHVPDHALLDEREQLEPTPLPATPENVERARDTSATLSAERRHDDDRGHPRVARFPARSATACDSSRS